MREGMLHICDVEGPKKTGSMEARLEAMEQQVFRCQGMVERGLNANHMMITEFTNKHKIDTNNIGKHLSRLYDKIDHLQAQIYDLLNQNFEERHGVTIVPVAKLVPSVPLLHRSGQDVMASPASRVIHWVLEGADQPSFTQSCIASEVLKILS
ncbi:40S ribosomal protein S5-1 [Hordeum vulgare]|nr:40S ribosomal protein S5-1 [Hordeum vulgare]